MSSRKRSPEHELIALEGELAEKKRKLLQLQRMKENDAAEEDEEEDPPLELFDSDSNSLLEVQPVSPPEKREETMITEEKEEVEEPLLVTVKSTKNHSPSEKPSRKDVKKERNSTRHDENGANRSDRRSSGDERRSERDRRHRPYPERERRRSRGDDDSRRAPDREDRRERRKDEDRVGKDGGDLRAELDRRRREREARDRDREANEKTKEPDRRDREKEREKENDKEKIKKEDDSKEKQKPKAKDTPPVVVIDSSPQEETANISMPTEEKTADNVSSITISDDEVKEVVKLEDTKDTSKPDQSDADEGGDVDMETGPLPIYHPAISGCRSVEKEYEYLNRIEEGTYGVVYRARDKKTNEIVALKKVKMEKEKEGFPITSLREINMLLKARHPNIVHVREIVVGNSIDKIYIVMEYVEHDLKALMESMKQPFLVGETKMLMLQLLRAVQHLHDNWILHRDLKLSNLLLSHKGILKVGDFGLAREYGSPLKDYTQLVVTLWYRAPELLLGAKSYSTAIDMWSVGCIFGELLQHKPLFPGKSEIDQVNKIFKGLGTPSEKIWPGWSALPAVQKVNFAVQPYNNLRTTFPYLSECGLDLLNKFLTYYPSRRISADDSLKHKYFAETPLPVDPSMFPTWPAKSELSRTQRRDASPVAPTGGQKIEETEGVDPDPTGGFHMNLANQGYAAKGPGFSLRF